MYGWAGEFRTVNISKGGRFFGAAAVVEVSLQDLLLRLRSENHLRGVEPQVFARRAGFYLGEINAIHPFRDGNGRAQREFLRELGQAGDSSGMAAVYDLAELLARGEQPA